MKHTAVVSLALSGATAFTIRRQIPHLKKSVGSSLVYNNARKRGTPFGMSIYASFLSASSINYNTLDHPGLELAKLAEEDTVVITSPQDPHLHAATFAGGCFWGLELAYQRVPGVAYTAVGYTQSLRTEDRFPTYEQVCSGRTDHTEAVIVFYDPKECSYDTLLDTFFGRVDITTVNGQGNDYGCVVLCF